MLVVDASVITTALAAHTSRGSEIRARIHDGPLAAPDLLPVEVVSALRRQVAAGQLSLAHAEAAIDDLLDLPVATHPTAPLLRRAWALRGNVSTYDACYVALAEALACPLLTADRRLAGAPGLRCPVELV